MEQPILKGIEDSMTRKKTEIQSEQPHWKEWGTNQRSLAQ